jgi:hypothetical protein
MEFISKPTQVALTACMRKLLTILNSIARDRTPWQSGRTTLRSAAGCMRVAVAWRPRAGSARRPHTR